MRIGIDVRYLSHGLLGGVHTYVAEFVPAVIRLAPHHQFFLYADTKSHFELEELPSNACVRRMPWSGPLSSVYHDLFMRRRMQQDRVELAHFPTNYGFGPAGARTVLTVHDALTLLPLGEILYGLRHSFARPRMWDIAMSVYIHCLAGASLRHADLVLTVSNDARNAIAATADISLDRIVAVPHGAPSDLKQITDEQTLAAVRAEYELRRPFVLADALKNPAALIDAWRRLPPHLRASHQIVFFSRRAQLLPIVAEAVEEGLAQLILRPSRSTLNSLYSMALAFAFPSWVEGFGLPLLEAMTAGAPVIASDRGSIPEIAGDAALLVDAEDSESLARFLELILIDSRARQRLRDRGFARAAQFSWSNTARRILESYEAVVGGPDGAHHLGLGTTRAA